MKDVNPNCLILLAYCYSYLFSNMQFSKQPEKFIDQNQFLLADSYYTSDWFTLPAYKGKVSLDHLNFDFNYHLAQSQVRIEHAIGILKEMKDTIKWIISCVVLHNLLADLKDQWNELYEEDEPDSALVAEDNIENSNNGICGILHPITLSHFEKPQ
ncbi:hypothetical protein VP01_3356g1 [Puccinia sorghi]|uniref:DDE Tnp4 domain-containing protein n=1 Tax=Puccinia sorghi TaxID=27349 RepID=A0A0L6UYW1_9BASI|nr:hypothetical protein VP01_3356g1 [Puccinia sorghi]